MSDRISGCSTILTLSVEGEDSCGTATGAELTDPFYFHDYSPQGLSLTTASSPDACLFMSRTFVTGSAASGGSFGGSLSHADMCLPIYAACGLNDVSLSDFRTGSGGQTINISESLATWTLREYQADCPGSSTVIAGTQITGFDFSSSLGSFTTMSFPFQGASPFIAGPVGQLVKPSPTEFFNDSTTTISVEDNSPTGVTPLVWPTADDCDYIDISLNLSRDVAAADTCRGNGAVISGCDNVSGGKLTGTLSMYMGCTDISNMELYVNGINAYQITITCEDAAGGKLVFFVTQAAWTSITPTWEQNGSRTYEMAFEGTVGGDFSTPGSLMTVTHTDPNA